MLFATVILLCVRVALFTPVPSYIQLCSLKDPHIEQCVINSVEKLKPKLRDGLKEMDVPPLEPLALPQVTISQTSTFKAIATNVLVHGASDFEIRDLKLKFLPNEMYEFDILIHIPQMVLDAQYEVAGKIMLLPLNGKGPLTATASDIEGKAVLKGKVVDGDEKDMRIVDFYQLDLKLKIGHYSVNMENLFGGDKALGDAINLALNENKKQVLRILGPLLEKSTTNILLEIANKITKKYDYRDLFLPS